MRLLIAAAGGLTAYLLIGLFLGVAPTFQRQARPRRNGRMRRWLAQVGSPLTPAQFVAASTCIGLAAWVVLAFLMGEWFSSFFPASGVSGYLAWSFERRRRERLRSIEEAWPDAIRHLLSYVRSGSTIPLASGGNQGAGDVEVQIHFEPAKGLPQMGARTKRVTRTGAKVNIFAELFATGMLSGNQTAKELETRYGVSPQIRDPG